MVRRRKGPTPKGGKLETKRPEKPSRWRSLLAWNRRTRGLQRSLCALAGVVLIAAAIATLVEDDAIWAHPAEAEAQVVDVDHDRRSLDLITVEFTSADGKTHSAEIFQGGRRVGERITIEYDATNPSHARVQGSDEQFLYGLLGAVLGPVLVLLAWVNPRLSRTDLP